MSPYLWIMIAGSVAVFALYGLRCARAVRLPDLRKRAWETALLSCLLAGLFGLVLARVGYALLMQELDFEYDGLEALTYLLEIEITNVSFFCGAAGVCLGVLLANRLTRKGTSLAGLDAFAPFGALLAALFRLGELFFGTYGLGRSLPEDSPLAFFPLAAQVTDGGGYTSWRWAVCVLSAVFALVWAAVAFFRLRSRNRTGYSFTLTLFFLSLTQILCESLRTRGMFWLFVHVEQLLCAVTLLGVLLFWILRSGKGLPFSRRWWPVGLLLLCAGLLVGVEFAIDGKILNLHLSVSYLIMCALLVVISFAGAAAAKRWNRENPR